MHYSSDLKEFAYNKLKVSQMMKTNLYGLQNIVEIRINDSSQHFFILPQYFQISFNLGCKDRLRKISNYHECFRSVNGRRLYSRCLGKQAWTNLLQLQKMNSRNILHLFQNLVSKFCNLSCILFRIDFESSSPKLDYGLS